MRMLAMFVAVGALCLSLGREAGSDTGMKVGWRTSLDEAKRSAAECGKPILLFTLLGRLDQEYC